MKVTKNKGGSITFSSPLGNLRKDSPFSGHHYSPSFIQSWEACPASEALREAYKPSPSKACEIGIRTHEVLKSYVLNEPFEHIFNTDEEDIDREVKSRWKAVVRHPDVIPEDGVVERIVEKPLYAKVTKYGVVLPVLKGIPDRIDIYKTGDYNLYDYKTSKKKINAQDHTFQMSIYKMIAIAHLKRPPSKVYITALKKTKPRNLEVFLTSEMEDDAAGRILQVDKEVKESQGIEFEKRRGDKCYWCPFRNLFCARNPFL